jgi:hypothetical protein
VYCGINWCGFVNAVLVAGTSKQQARYTTMAGKPASNNFQAEHVGVLKKHLCWRIRACSVPRGQQMGAAARQ